MAIIRPQENSSSNHLSSQYHKTMIFNPKCISRDIARATQPLMPTSTRLQTHHGLCLGKKLQSFRNLKSKSLYSVFRIKFRHPRPPLKSSKTKIRSPVIKSLHHRFGKSWEIKSNQKTQKKTRARSCPVLSQALLKVWGEETKKRICVKPISATRPRAELSDQTSSSNT